MSSSDETTLPAVAVLLLTAAGRPELSACCTGEDGQRSGRAVGPGVCGAAVELQGLRLGAGNLLRAGSRQYKPAVEPMCLDREQAASCNGGHTYPLAWPTPPRL